MESIVIVGSSGHAKVVADLVEQEGRYQIVGFLDRYRGRGERAFDYEVLGSEEDLPRIAQEHGVMGALVAVGDNFVRSDVVARIRERWPAIRFVTAIHPRATVAREVSIAEGTVVMAGATVNPCCSIGRFCILNTHSSLDHDSCMHEFSSIAPAASTGGNCSLGPYSAVGIGAVLAHRTSVGEHTVIGAGSTVLYDVPPFSVAFGTPAKVIRSRKPGDRYL